MCEKYMDRNGKLPEDREGDGNTTINDTREYHRNTGYLLRDVDMGIPEFVGMGYHVDDGQMTQTDEL